MFVYHIVAFNKDTLFCFEIYFMFVNTVYLLYEDCLWTLVTTTSNIQLHAENYNQDFLKSFSLFLYKIINVI